MVARLPDWGPNEAGTGYVTEDDRGRVWEMRTARFGLLWMLTCEGNPFVTSVIEKRGGLREFDLAEEYIRAMS